MLIEPFIPNPDAIETHEIEIAASREAVYQALWTTDLGGSPIIKILMALRSLPGIVSHPKRLRHLPGQITLQTIIEGGFGQLAEEPAPLLQRVRRGGDDPAFIRFNRCFKYPSRRQAMRKR